ncbi:MAG TPA: translocation/assembly module TamB domain-containing protein [Stellaceae bacterium]|nr:translocation/assembly module TamB domain-containing protein [Stellaceae bacterium]
MRELTAGDSAGGNIAARGSLALGGTAGPVVDFSAKLSSFRIAARDEAVVTASGTLTVAGGVTAPKITGQLTVDRADCTIPDSLPPSVTTLKVVEINGPAARRGRRPAPQAETAFAAPIDIEITLPGQTFVRGHGLDSEWRGKLRVGGTSAAPAITGSLENIRGTFDILGKTFRVSHGVIAFDGGTAFDPRLDISAEIAAADITAQALVSGVASAPTVTLSSTPVVPQDEILSRVLFGRGLGQISAGEGLQVAQAAATLAGGGPGVLDKLRTGLGLDRLGFGPGANGAASSTLNPAAGGAATGRPSISGGKYIANGVYVGATQGTTPNTNKVTVEVDVYPHVTIETDRNQSGGTGIGLNYKYDY